MIYEPEQKKWVGKDSNLRRHKPSDLQSDAFNRFATYPFNFKLQKYRKNKLKSSDFGTETAFYFQFDKNLISPE